MNFIKSIFLAIILVTASTNMVFSQTDVIQVENTTETIIIKVKGVGCSGDLARISENIQKTEGVKKCEILKQGALSKLKVDFDPAVVSVKELNAVVENTDGCGNQTEKPYKVKGK